MEAWAAMGGSRSFLVLVALVAFTGCAEEPKSARPCEGDLAFPRNYADSCGYWCPHDAPEAQLDDAVVCGAEETCTQAKCEPMRERALWPLPPSPAVPENYETDGSTLLDLTTGLRFRLELLEVPGATVEERREGARSACEKLPGRFRLPHWIELMTIVDYGGREKPALIEPFDQGISAVYYWRPIGREQSNARHDDPDDPYDTPSVFAIGASDANGAEGAICVQSTRPAPEVAERLVVEDETIRDAVTGLRWQLSSNPTNPLMGVMSAEAVEYCSTLDTGGFSVGWRVPSLLELFSLRHARGGNSLTYDGLDPDVFVDVDRWGQFWSSTPTSHTELTETPSFVVDATHWAVHFDGFEVFEGASRVRCVRGPE